MLKGFYAEVLLLKCLFAHVHCRRSALPVHQLKNVTFRSPQGLSNGCQRRILLQKRVPWPPYQTNAKKSSLVVPPALITSVRQSSNISLHLLHGWGASGYFDPGGSRLISSFLWTGYHLVWTLQTGLWRLGHFSSMAWRCHLCTEKRPVLSRLRLLGDKDSWRKCFHWRNRSDLSNATIMRRICAIASGRATRAQAAAWRSP